MNRLVVATAVIGLLLAGLILIPKFFANRDFVELSVNSQEKVLRQIEADRFTIPAFTTSTSGLLGVVGLVLVVPADGTDTASESEIAFDRQTTLPVYRPPAENLLVEPLDKVLYEGRVTNDLSSGGAFTEFTAALTEKQVAEVIVKDEVYFGYRNVSEIPFEDLKLFMRSAADPMSRYLFVENATLTTTVYRTFDEAEGTGDYAGTTFKVNGRIFASTQGFASRSTLSLTFFDMSLLEVGEAGDSSSELEIRELLRKHAQQSLSPDQTRSLLELLRDGTRETSTPRASNLDMKDIDTSDATVTAASLGFSDEDSLMYNFRVSGNVPHLQQSSPHTCWATVATMLNGWKTQRAQQTDSYLETVHSDFARLFRNGASLKRRMKERFLNEAGLEFVWGQSFHPDGLLTLLRNHGPIWFTTTADNELSRHARVVIALIGTGDMERTHVVYIDPSDGMEHSMKYGTFMSSYEQVAFADNEDGGALEGFQVVHYP